MSTKDSALRMLCARYPLLSAEVISSGLDKLLVVLKSGKNTDFSGEPLRTYASPVDWFLGTLDFNHAGRVNYEYLLGDKELARRGMEASPPRVAKHDPSRNGYQRKYQKNRYHKRKEEAIKALGGKCSSCGSTRNLELDHKNPANKSFTITKLWGVEEEEFQKEVKKCRLLCNSCHRKNTGKQREEGTVKSVPGKSKYKDNRKKAFAERLEKVAAKMSFQEAANLGARIAKAAIAGFDDVELKLATDFRKSDRIDTPVLTWTVFRKGDRHQLLYRLYGREKDAKLFKDVLASVKEALRASEVDLEYEDDLTEPGLMVRTLSGLSN